MCTSFSMYYRIPHKTWRRDENWIVNGCVEAAFSGCTTSNGSDDRFIACAFCCSDLLLLCS